MVRTEKRDRRSKYPKVVSNKEGYLPNPETGVRVTKSLLHDFDETRIYQRLEAIYLDPEHPGSFSGVANLYNSSKHIPGITYKKVKDYLRSKVSYTRHFPRRYSFSRRKIVSFKIDQIWQIDLMQMDTLAHWNGGIHYILVVIDTLSSFMWVLGVKRKSGSLVSQAFETILKRAYPRKPILIYNDEGTEFFNKQMFAVLERYGIKMYTTNNREIKASQCERIIRTLKGRLYKYLTEKKTWKYLDVLDHIVSEINRTKTRSHGFRPIDVDVSNEDTVFKRRYKVQNGKNKPYKFKVGMVVRTAQPRTPFDKGYKPNFSQQLFRIVDRQATNPHIYRVAKVSETGETGEVIDKAYYSEQIVDQRFPDFAMKYKDPPVRKRII